MKRAEFKFSVTGLHSPARRGGLFQVHMLRAQV